MTQYGVKPGDTITVGGAKFAVLGSVTKLPGEANAFASIAPRVLIPRGQMPAQLLSRGSVVRYFSYLKLPPGDRRGKAFGETPKGRGVQEVRVGDGHRRAPGTAVGAGVPGREPLLEPGEFHRAAAGRDRGGERDPRAPENQAADRGRAAVPGSFIVADAGDLPDPGTRARVGGGAVRGGGGRGIADAGTSVSAERAADQFVVRDLLGRGGGGRGRGIPDVRAVRVAAALAGAADPAAAGAALGVRVQRRGTVGGDAARPVALARVRVAVRGAAVVPMVAEPRPAAGVRVLGRVVRGLWGARADGVGINPGGEKIFSVALAV